MDDRKDSSPRPLQLDYAAAGSASICGLPFFLLVAVRGALALGGRLGMTQRTIVPQSGPGATETVAPIMPAR